MKKSSGRNKANDMRDLITPAEAARVRGVTRAAIGDLVRRGRLHSTDIGGRPFLYRSEVENFEKMVEGRPSTGGNREADRFSETTRNLNRAFRRATDRELKKGKK